MCRLCRQKRREFISGQLSAGGTAASQHEGGDLLTKFRAPSVCVSLLLGVCFICLTTWKAQMARLFEECVTE